MSEMREKVRALLCDFARDLREKEFSGIAFVSRDEVVNDILAAVAPSEAFQDRVQPWMMECFGPEISADKLERNDRFIEEALELVQACGYDRTRAHVLVDYVFGRPAGEPRQEVGGVMVTLAALCLAQDLDMQEAGEAELARIWTKVEKIRAKQAAKPRGSALPIAIDRRAPSAEPSEEARREIVQLARDMLDADTGGYANEVWRGLVERLMKYATPARTEVEVRAEVIEELAKMLEVHAEELSDAKAIAFSTAANFIRAQGGRDE